MRRQTLRECPGGESPRYRRVSDRSEEGRARFAGARELEPIVARLEGSGLKAEERGGAGRAAETSVGHVQRGSEMRALGVLMVPGRLTRPALPGGCPWPSVRSRG